MIIITDNVFNNCIMQQKLNLALISHYRIVWDYYVTIISCMTYVLQLTVKTFLLTLNILTVNERVNIHWYNTALSDIEQTVFFKNTMIKIKNVLLKVLLSLTVHSDL